MQDEDSAPGTPTQQGVFSAVTGPPRLKSVISIPWLNSFSRLGGIPPPYSYDLQLSPTQRTPSTLMVRLLGILWQWAPFALISAEIAKERSRARTSTFGW